MPIECTITYYTIEDIQLECKLTTEQICALAEELWSSDSSYYDEKSTFPYYQKSRIVEVYGMSKEWQ